MFAKENVIRTLQGWVCMVGVINLGNTLNCFIDHSFLASKVYLMKPEKVNDLTARLYGLWTLMNAFLKITCALCIYNKAVYNLTMTSFILALIHFFAETFLYETSTFSIGLVTPTLITLLSIIFMGIGYMYLNERSSSSEFEDTPKMRKVEDMLLRSQLRKNKDN